MNMFRAFMELDKLDESYMSRQELISELKALGKRYDFNKYSDAQLYRIWEKAVSESKSNTTPTEVQEPIIKRHTCDSCGMDLTDGGFCPRCDDGVEDFDECLVEEKKGRIKSSKRMLESWETEFLAIDGFDYIIDDTFVDDGHTGYEVTYARDGKDIVSVEVWDENTPVTVLNNLYAPNLMQHLYSNFNEFAEDIVYKCDTYLTESKVSSNKVTYKCDDCGFEIEMSEDEFDGCCPACHEHSGNFGPCEESLSESIPANWVNYKGAWIYPIDNGFEANLDGLHYEATTEAELKTIIDAAIKDGYTKDKKLAQYMTKPNRISHRAIWENTSLYENWADDKMEELFKKPRDSWDVDDWTNYYYCLNANAERDYYDSLDESIGLRDTEVSTQQAVISVVDQIKMIYEAGFFAKLPVGRKNAFTIDIYGPDKERLVGYFRKQPEFNYEVNTDQGIISHEFISSEYDVEIFDEFVSMYKIPQNESLNEAPFLNNWVTSSGDKFSWNNTNSTPPQQSPATPATPATQQNSPTTNISYIIASSSSLTANSSDFYCFESDGNWYGEVGTADALRAPYSYFATKQKAFASAEQVIKELNLSWVDLFIYEYDEANKTVTVVDSLKATNILNTNNKQSAQTSGYIVEIVWDPKASKLRARSDDGVHGPANVAFPNNLRTQGAKYKVDTLTWNGKNYRASGNIVSI